MKCSVGVKKERSKVHAWKSFGFRHKKRDTILQKDNVSNEQKKTFPQKNQTKSMVEVQYLLQQLLLRRLIVNLLPL